MDCLSAAAVEVGGCVVRWMESGLMVQMGSLSVRALNVMEVVGASPLFEGGDNMILDNFLNAVIIIEFLHPFCCRFFSFLVVLEVKPR